jgi:GTP-binding protein Era
LDLPKAGLLAAQVNIWVETTSQRGILIGKQGQMIKAIGVGARQELEQQMGQHVHLDLTVKVRKHWRERESLLDQLELG